MTDFPKVSADALRFLERDGWQKSILGSPIYFDDPTPPTAHCVGGLLNMALTKGASASWQSTPEADTVYEKAAGIMRSRWEGYLPEEEGKWFRQEYTDAPSVIAIINNTERFTEDDVRALFAELAAAE